MKYVIVTAFVLIVNMAAIAQSTGGSGGSNADKNCRAGERERMGPVGNTGMGERQAEKNCDTEKASDPGKFEKDHGRDAKGDGKPKD